MKITASLISIFLLFQFAYCKTLKETKTDSLVIEFEKTTCRGECPSYIFKVMENRTIIYKGRENTKMIGNYKGKLTEKQFSDLINHFEEVDFFAFNDSYQSFMMDLPTKYITYVKNGKTKKIKAYDNIPKKLINLIQQLDELISTIEWKKV
jgi:hypothetical protein